jgi:DNA polymerase-4
MLFAINFVQVTNLIPGKLQITLFDAKEEMVKLYLAVHSIKKQFGEGLLIRAVGASRR